MPLYLADSGREVCIKRITGSDSIRSHLETMGFLVGEWIRVVSRVNENVIVKIKGVSIALSHELAKRIFV